MKVLLAAPYIYIKGHKHGSRNQSGLAYMIRDIAEMLSDQGAEVYVLTQSVFTEKMKVGNINMLPKQLIHMVIGCKAAYLKYALKAIRKESYSISKKVRILMYFLTGGYLESTINRIKPDVVHIHSIGLYTLPFIMACIRTGTKFVVTLHGLVSFTEYENSGKLEKSLEKEYLNFAQKFDVTTTVVSTGVKNRIENWQKGNSDYIKVILNSFKQDCVKAKTNNDSNKLILCVGSLSDRKNQLQAIRAFELLKDKRKEGYKLLLVGDGPKREELEGYIRDHNLHEVQCVGKIERSQVQELYDRASLLVMSSIDEGFGLPVIEAYSKGIPAVAFADLDAIPDLYNEDTMILVDERTDIALSKGIEQALEKEWDKENIKSYYKKFQPSAIGFQYYDLLSSCEKTHAKTEDFTDMLQNLF